VRCEYCFKPVGIGDMRLHQIIHKDGVSYFYNRVTPRRAYLFPRFIGTDFFCVLGEDCGFQTSDYFEILGHFALGHTFEELKHWGFRKDLLMYMYGAHLDTRKPELDWVRDRKAELSK
jgi:hypothetical protein